MNTFDSFLTNKDRVVHCRRESAQEKILNLLVTVELLHRQGDARVSVADQLDMSVPDQLIDAALSGQTIFLRIPGILPTQIAKRIELAYRHYSKGVLTDSEWKSQYDASIQRIAAWASIDSEDLAPRAQFDEFVRLWQYIVEAKPQFFPPNYLQLRYEQTKELVRLLFKAPDELLVQRLLASVIELMESQHLKMFSEGQELETYEVVAVLKAGHRLSLRLVPLGVAALLDELRLLVRDWWVGTLDCRSFVDRASSSTRAISGTNSDWKQELRSICCDIAILASGSFSSMTRRQIQLKETRYEARRDLETAMRRLILHCEAFFGG